MELQLFIVEILDEFATFSLFHPVFLDIVVSVNVGTLVVQHEAGDLLDIQGFDGCIVGQAKGILQVDLEGFLIELDIDKFREVEFEIKGFFFEEFLDFYFADFFQFGVVNGFAAEEVQLQLDFDRFVFDQTLVVNFRQAEFFV